MSDLESGALGAPCKECCGKVDGEQQCKLTYPTLSDSHGGQKVAIQSLASAETDKQGADQYLIWTTISLARAVIVLSSESCIALRKCLVI